MPDYEGQHYPTMSPYLFYADGAAALAFLTSAFGFTERMRTDGPDGGVGHAEVELGDSVVMLGCPPDFKTPAQLGSITAGVYVHVDDVDAHHAHAKASGANVQDPPTDQPYGVRSYGVLDPEGHQWWFAQVI
jgi:uncharacterized glyoxalase superfamily protein PhnB